MLARLRGVRAAGWIGSMPEPAWVWMAFGLWRGVMEVSVVGIGSVSLGLFWVFFAAAASLALIGSGSLVGIEEFFTFCTGQVR